MNEILLNDAKQCVERQQSLLTLIKETYPQEQGALLFCSGFEREREQFYQDSTFHYFFGSSLL